MIQTANLPWKMVVLFFALFFTFFLGMESLAHARAGGGEAWEVAVLRLVPVREPIREQQRDLLSQPNSRE